MSAQIRSILAEERAREPAIGPCAAIPLITDEQCAAVDETGEHLDREIAEESDPWWLLLAGALAIVCVIVWSVYHPWGVGS